MFLFVCLLLRISFNFVFVFYVPPLEYIKLKLLFFYYDYLIFCFFFFLLFIYFICIVKNCLFLSFSCLCCNCYSSWILFVFNISISFMLAIQIASGLLLILTNNFPTTVNSKICSYNFCLFWFCRSIDEILFDKMYK